MLRVRTMSTIHDNRLTRVEYAAIDARVGGEVDRLTRAPSAYRPAGWEWEVAAHNAIGCNSHDLRTVELRLIVQQCDALCQYACGITPAWHATTGGVR